jgi:PAS domain S-box-containing protein
MTGVSIESLGLHRSVASSEERLRALIDAAPVGIIESDARGNARWWNATASRLLGWRTPDSGEPPEWPSDVTDQLSDMWADLLSGRPVSAREFSAGLASRERIISAAVTVLPSARNEASVLSLLDDITDQQELREEVRHAHRMELRGQVASSVAHDFNNLITLISGYAEMLGREVADRDRANSLVHDILTTSQRAASLTTQLQSLGRTTTNTKTTVDVSAALASNAEVLERIMGNSVAVVWELDTVPTPVHVDPNLFEQMILNLAINARDAMPDGGTLTVSSARTVLTDAEARERSVSPGPVVRLRISDTGYGMDDATLQRCFEPLFTTKGPYRGTGMGLASARRFVDESGGSIRAESEIGRGTTFDIVLPGLEITPRVLTPPSEHQSSLNATVLVVEDDPVLRRMVVQVLSRHGLTLLDASSGEDALALMTASEQVDLLITDMDLGAISGLDVARSYTTRWPNGALIVMSGRPLAHIVSEFPESSAQFLPKPFRPTHLVEVAVGALTHHQETGSNR